MTKAHPLTAIAAGAVLVLALAGCTSTARSDAGWVPKPHCPTPAALAAASALPSLKFAAHTSQPETLTKTGCAYLAGDNATRLDVERDPGPPSEIAFGTAAHLTITQKPKLGPGAETARSSSFRALIAPASGGATLQIQVIASGDTDIASACRQLTTLLPQFATRRTT
ncbi:hypothetical protein ACFOYW_17390 [Gryllotalpicola reticulitermitis]|uniref:DUF3558 domain-containing protein n=1 Tax=Gryllotalpicola reticulitermitis TaxID=1184153 RepID=A0ABV8QA06_9MICO